MSWFAAYLHLVFTVFLVGYTFYWTVMVVALRRDFAPPETEQLLEIASRSRWPHVLVPWRLRLRLPFMGWGFVAILLITGVALTASRGLNAILVLKLALVGTFMLIQAWLTRRPVRGLIVVNFAVVLVIVVLSGMMVRI